MAVTRSVVVVNFREHMNFGALKLRVTIRVPELT